MAPRGFFTESEWTIWLEGVARIEGDAFSSVENLRRRHNLTAFLLALHVNVTLGENAGDDILKPGLEAAIKRLP
jgi:hypothetical protein